MANGSAFQPGFRLSWLDVAVLLVGATGAAMVARIDLTLALIIGFVVIHFFLFCNVFRLSRPPELIWAAAFTACAAATMTLSWPGWNVTFVGAAVVSTLLIAREMRKPHYHGVFWQRLNPGLEAWWTARAEDCH